LTRRAPPFLQASNVTRSSERGQAFRFDHAGEAGGGAS
jgi:hypothetical protein